MGNVSRCILKRCGKIIRKAALQRGRANNLFATDRVISSLLKKIQNKIIIKIPTYRKTQN